MRRVRRAVKPPPFQGGNHEFKSRTRHQYAPVIQWKNNALLMRRSEVQILSGAPFHTQTANLLKIISSLISLCMVYKAHRQQIYNGKQKSLENFK